MASIVNIHFYNYVCIGSIAESFGNTIISIETVEICSIYTRDQFNLSRC